MKLVKLIAVLSWLNLTAVTWALLLNPYLREHPNAATWTAIFFLLVAVIFTSLSQEKKENESQTKHPYLDRERKD